MILTYWITIIIIFILLLLMFICNKTTILKHNKINSFFSNNLLKYVVKRILFSIATLFLILTVTFFLMRIMPKDYFYNFTEASTDINYYSNNLNSDNLFKQLFNFYYNVLPFPKKVCSSTYLNNGCLECSSYSYKIVNLGYSHTYMKNVKVWTIIKEKCSTSLLIGVLAYVLQCLIGYPLGIYMAKKENGFIDKSANIMHTIIIFCPAIVYFYLFVILFMVVFKLPVTFEFDNPLSYLAPLTALSLWGGFTVAYWVKKYVSIEAKSDYVTYAISKGLSTNTVFYKHVMKNALIPLIRTIPTSLVLCLTGFYLLESAFGIPGIGLTFITAINLQDVYLVQGLIIFYGILSVCAYLLGDLITIFFDHRVNLEKDVLKND